MEGRGKVSGKDVHLKHFLISSDLTLHIFYLGNGEIEKYNTYNTKIINSQGGNVTHIFF